LVPIVFILLFLGANTELGQLFKLPVLIHHYLEHVELNKNESFADFLQIHYQKEINHPDDVHGDHQRLPFKSADCHSIQTPVILPQTHFEIADVSVHEEHFKEVFSYEESHSSTRLVNIWQPPRFC
jgi:hypothetical protein